MTQEIKLELKNGARIISAFEKAPALFASEFAAGMKKLGQYVSKTLMVQVIRNNEGGFPPPKDRPTQTPLWRTGAMLGGIDVIDSQPLRVTIAPSSITPYAIFVHQGTYKMTARPFFQVLADKHKTDIEKFMGLILNDITQKIANSIK